jgi:uncharacterized coiled-coil DUF342 family protein
MAGKYDNAFPNAQKVQIFEQVDTYIENNNPIDPEIKTAIADLQTLITTLQTQHLNITTETQAIDIIDAEFKELEASQSPQWQNLLSLKRLYNGSKKAALKVGEHFAQENVWGKAVVALLEGVSEDVE